MTKSLLCPGETFRLRNRYVTVWPKHCCPVYGAPNRQKPRPKGVSAYLQPQKHSTVPTRIAARKPRRPALSTVSCIPLFFECSSFECSSVLLFPSPPSRNKKRRLPSHSLPVSPSSFSGPYSLSPLPPVCNGTLLYKTIRLKKERVLTLLPNPFVILILSAPFHIRK